MTNLLAHSSGSTRGRVLVVDDDASSRSGLAKLLRTDGYAVDVAASGEAALDEATRMPPDVVLTDLEMPGMNGVELCRRLLEVTPKLPVILMTGHSGMESAIESLRAGAEDYLLKPLQYEAVVWRLERTLARHAASRLQEQQYEEYLSLISHDLLNPLSNIRLCVGVLGESLEKMGLVAEVKLTERAKKNVGRMTAMLNELSEATSLESRGLSMKLGTCDLGDLAAGVLESMGGAAARIRLENDDALPHLVVADRSRLERVITNLFSNALKYSPDVEDVRAHITRSGGVIQLAVIDRGIGIAPESIDRLFDRYYRSPAGQAKAGGLGLGLYIARLVIEAFGGQIAVVSEIGRGSTFTMTLPSIPVAA